MCFGSLEFVATSEGELVRTSPPSSPPTSDLDMVVEALDELQVSSSQVQTPVPDQRPIESFDGAKYQLMPYLRPNPSWESARTLEYHVADIMTRHAGGEPISSTALTMGASTAFPFALCNAVVTASGQLAMGHASTPDDIEFVGMIGHGHDPIYDDLSSIGSDSLSDFCSDNGSCHPSRECYLVDLGDISDGHVSDASESTHHGTPPRTPSPEGQAAAAPAARHTTPWQLTIPQTHSKRGRPSSRRPSVTSRKRSTTSTATVRTFGTRSSVAKPAEANARAMARDVHRRILEDDEGPPRFTRASQNIAAAAALL